MKMRRCFTDPHYWKNLRSDALGKKGPLAAVAFAGEDVSPLSVVLFRHLLGLNLEGHPPAAATMKSSGHFSQPKGLAVVHSGCVRVILAAGAMLATSKA